MNHLKQIAAKLPEYGIDAMLITSEPGEFYAVDLHGEGVVIVAPGAVRYITDSRYIEVAKATVEGAEVLSVTPGADRTSLINEFLDAHSVKKLGIEDNYVSLGQYDAFKTGLHAELCFAGELVTKLRWSKDGEELSRMVEAQRITDEAFSAMLDFIKPGMTEAQIAARLVYEMFSRGVNQVSFDPIVASGPNGSKPHAIPGLRQVQEGDFITMDFGCKYMGYCSDMTRTIALGRVSDEQRKVYETVLTAQLTAIEASRAGIPGRELHGIAARVIADAGYGEYFGHGYGHSAGIEIHEAPYANSRDATPLPVGAMVSAEPGIYLPGRFGVRIEDMVRMEEGGHLDITHSPKELIIL